MTLPQKLQPHSTAFIQIADPKAVLEMAFRSFACLTKGDVVCVHYNDTKYYLNVLEVKPDQFNAVSIIEADVQLDFAPPVDHVEPAAAPDAAASSLPPAKRHVSVLHARAVLPAPTTPQRASAADDDGAEQATTSASGLVFGVAARAAATQH